MSYDLHLFRPQPGVDPAVSAKESVADWRGESNPGPMLEEKEEAKRRLAAALMSHNPALEPFAFDPRALAKLDNVSEQEAGRRYRHIELSDHDRGIQIVLYDDRVAVHLAYGQDAAATMSALGGLFDYLRILERDGGYTTFDPQLDRVLDLQSDLEPVLGAYRSAVPTGRSSAP